MYVLFSRITFCLFYGNIMIFSLYKSFFLEKTKSYDSLAGHNRRSLFFLKNFLAPK